jgi:hypothetical protein
MSTLKVDNITDAAGTGFPQLNGTTPGIKWQKKEIGASVANISSGTLTALGFSGLTIGNTYRITLAIQAFTSTDSEYRFQIVHDSTEIVEVSLGDAGGSHETAMASTIFTATATSTSVTYDGGNSASDVLGTTFSGGPSTTYAIIEELPYHTETTDFT